MDDKAKELIAVGASIAGHCQPCLSYHANKAKELGIEEQEIKEAIAVGYMVEKGAMSAMRKFSEGACAMTTEAIPTCCSDDGPQCADACCT